MQSRKHPHKLPTPILVRNAHTSRHEAVRPDQEHPMLGQAGRLLPALLACYELSFRANTIGSQFNARVSSAFLRRLVPAFSIQACQQDEMMTSNIKS